MTVEEIKALAPESDVYRLDENSRYLVVFSRNHVPMSVLSEISAASVFPDHTAFLYLEDPKEAVRLFEFKRDAE